MKKQVYGILAATMLVASCGSNNENSVEETMIDSVAVAQEEIGEEVEAGLAFDGVQKGEYTLFGHEDVSADEAVSQEEMYKIFAETGAFDGKVSVTINEVCQKAGCWVNFKKSENEKVMVFFRDHFTIPIKESAGKDVILYGMLESDTLTVDFQKHLLDDAAEAGEVINQEDYDEITEDKIDVSFDCVSILVKD